MEPEPHDHEAAEETSASSPEDVGLKPSTDQAGGLPNELFIGLVTPVGTDTADLVTRVRGRLSEWDYKSVVVHISDGLPTQPEDNEHEDDRIERLINAGNEWVRTHNSDFGIGPLILREIQKKRLEIHVAAGLVGDEIDLRKLPVHRMAYIIHSLKRPGEVEFLRSVYRSLFVLLGCQSTPAVREDRLAKRLEGRPFWNESRRRARALELMERDDREGGEYGQNVRKTYPLADVFVPANRDPGRAVSLLFGDTRLAPDTGEYAMYLAVSSAARSLTASRRVGASIVVGDSVIATGWNEVPLIQGEEPDAARGIDTSETRKRELIISTIQALQAKRWLSTDRDLQVTDNTQVDDWIKDAIRDLEDTPILNVIEFQRAVHAEMWAILDAAKRGVALKDAIIYGTTWPCHLCWKHIFAVGITKMYYIDSYPKSQATVMYSRTADMLEPFVGVAPRAYMRFFAERALPKADSLGRIPEPKWERAQPLVDARDATAYLATESKQIDELDALERRTQDGRTEGSVAD